MSGDRARLWSIVALVAAAVICILAGVGLQTAFRPAATIHEPVTLTGVGANVGVIGSDTLTAYEGDPIVTAEGSEDVYVAAGPAEDVDAWTADAQVAQVRWSDDAPKGARLTAAIVGSVAAPSPVGSDLWVASNQADDSAAVRVEDPEASAVIVTAGNGTNLPRAIDIEWTGQPGSPLAWPLIVAGAAALIAALGLAWSVYSRDRPGPRRRSHRRAQSGRHRTPGGARTLALAVPLVVGVVALSAGCSALGPDPSATGSASPSGEPRMVVTEAHFRSILGQISEAAQDADESGEPAKLLNRFAGPALSQRSESYAIRAKLPSQALLPAFPDDDPEVFLPQSSHRFPRTVFVIFSAADSGSPQAVVLQQADARSNYQVISDTLVVPGVEFPALPVASAGATIIDSSTSALVVRPDDLVSQYAAALSAPEDSEEAEDFGISGDVFATMTKELEASTREKLGADGVLDVARTEADAAPVAISTQSSGAVVAVAMNETWTWKPAQNNGRINLTDDLTKAMLDKDSTTAGVQQVYSTMLLFHVPASGSGHVTLLGYQQAPVSIKEL